MGSGASSEAGADRGESEGGHPLGGRQRHTLCVSSQVGCQMGCTFCATGGPCFGLCLRIRMSLQAILIGVVVNSLLQRNPYSRSCTCALCQCVNCWCHCQCMVCEQPSRAWQAPWAWWAT